MGRKQSFSLLVMGLSTYSPAKNLSFFAEYLADWHCSHIVDFNNGQDFWFLAHLF